MKLKLIQEQKVNRSKRIKTLKKKKKKKGKIKMEEKIL